MLRQQFGRVAQVRQLVPETIVYRVTGRRCLRAAPETRLHRSGEVFPVGEEILVEEQDELLLAEHPIGGGDGSVRHGRDDDRRGPNSGILGKGIDHRVPDRQRRLDRDSGIVQPQYLDAEDCEQLRRNRLLATGIGISDESMLLCRLDGGVQPVGVQLDFRARDVPVHRVAGQSQPGRDLSGCQAVGQ
ncbi:hypothetical protein [Nocardia niwae]|uniref:hypothetical protein n=1 Tax=Nocardia niwae TaxID=626084 RepID=UPI0033F95B5B